MSYSLCTQFTLQLDSGSLQTFSFYLKCLNSLCHISSTVNYHCREEVVDIMRGLPDGSYMVRNSARVPGEYTLTLK